MRPDDMTEREEQALKSMLDHLAELTEAQRYYILGIAEWTAMAKES